MGAPRQGPQYKCPCPYSILNAAPGRRMTHSTQAQTMVFWVYVPFMAMTQSSSEHIELLLLTTGVIEVVYMGFSE